jgi:hypothetical protein
MGPAKMLKIMESMDLAAEEVAYLDSKALSWKLNGASTTILFLSGGEALQFYVAVTDTRATKDDLMEFNKKWRYSRSYMDEDGDPVLELDLDLAGGVCEGRVKDWLATCELAFSTWIEALPRSPSGPAVPEAGTKGGTPSFRFPPVGPLSPDY